MPHTREAGRMAKPAAPGSGIGDADKDLPLREDTRLLGWLLGDTVREQQGKQVFDVIEQIRQTSIRFRRDEDEAARRELGEIMDRLSPAEASQIIRAFGYFSHLANIAEDQHRIRRTRAHAMAAAPPREGSMAHALARARDAGIGGEALRGFLATASISPVLTAHPTEALSRRGHGRRCRCRHPLDDKRHRGRAAQQRLAKRHRHAARRPPHQVICWSRSARGRAGRFRRPSAAR